MATTRKKPVGLNPITNIMDFKTFAKNPIVATLFLAICGISALYLDIRSTFQDQSKSQNIRIEKVEYRLDLVQDALRKSDSSGAVTASQLKMLNDLGAIKSLK
jgi:fumarate reductase subunit C